MASIIPLKHPITTGEGALINEITMERPKLGLIIKADKLYKNDEMAQIMHIVSQLTGLVPEDLQELDLEDWNEIQTQYLEMMGKFPK